ncbi:MAG: threonylcarbamoyl-AMP synthase [Muribaculaceae bacterium]|mgnify:FL=1|nr:threonylcarbamoyl-AMP synthase [Muribaculaceae bacterium]
MKILKIYPTSINMRFISEAVEAIEDGDIIVYPTDTLYALGCDALNNRSIESLCHLKGINPQKENLSIVCADISQAAEYARIDNRAFAILKRYLPGPYTFILPAATTLPKVFKGRKTVGVRIPDNDITRCLAETLGHPLLSTSVSGDAATGEPDEIALEYSEAATLMIDGGTCAGQQSTVVDLTDSTSPEVLRQGAGPFDE